MSKAFMRCILCGKKFQGYHVAVCDDCMDRQDPGEDWMDFLARMKKDQNKEEGED